MNNIKTYKLSIVLIVISMCIVLAIVLYPFIWLFLSSLKFEMDIVKFPPETLPERLTFFAIFPCLAETPLTYHDKEYFHLFYHDHIY